MKRWLRITLLVVAAGALAAVAVPVVRMGPRDFWGMLRYDQRQEGSLEVGHQAPDVALAALDGASARLLERRGTRPLVLVFGSYT
jgi:hypothetical protein